MDRAVELLERAVHVAPESAELHGMLAGLLNDLGRPNDEPLARALELDPDLSVALVTRAFARGGRGDVEGARADYARLALVDGPNREIHYGLGTTLLNNGRFDEAIAELDRAVEEPATAEAHVNRGICLFRLGRLPEALGALTTGFERKRSLVNALGFRGLVRATLGFTADARADLQRYLERFTSGTLADEARAALKKLR
jgi:Tfp pilus assembly protein PilF